MRRPVFLLFMLLLLALGGNSLFSAKLAATYSEEIDTTIDTSYSFGVGAPNYSIAFHVGTLTIQKTGNGQLRNYYGLTLDPSGYGNNPLTLSSSRPINGNSSFNAQLVAKINRNASTQVVVIDQDTEDTSLISTYYVNNYPITIDFYVRIAGIAAPELAAGAHFQFADPPGGDLGSFRVKTFYPILFFFLGTEYIDINNDDLSVPYFSTDYTSGSQNFINVNSEEPTVYASLTIEQTPEESSFLLREASGTQAKTVGLARISLSGYQSTNTYGVQIVFSDGYASQTPQFLLKHEEIDTYIPFTVLFGSESIENGKMTVWDNLVYGSSNTKILSVTGIDQSYAQTCVSGEYSDTIYVTITPLDSNVIAQ